MNRLTLNALGVPEVLFHERRLKFRSRKALALLIYLAVEQGPHSREHLINLLWPQSDPRSGRVSLRGALSQLRQALRPTGAPALVTTSDWVSLDKDLPLHLDLDTIAAALVPAAMADDWHRALAANRGDFLEGFSLVEAAGFDDWVTVQRQIWHRRLEAVCERLATAQLDAGAWSQALRSAARWVAFAPLSESAYRCLMTAQALTEDRAAALLTFHRCQQRFMDELGLKPGPETTSLAERIRQHDMDRGLEPRSAGRPNAQKPVSLPLPFVGRAAAHNRLIAAWQTAVQGATVAAAIVGQVGVGKTRLVESFLDWAQVNSTAVETWRGRAFEMGGHLPYQAVVASVRARMDRENAPEDLLDDVWLAELSQLLPELRARYPDLPPPLTGDADLARARLFAAVAEFGRVLAAHRPLIFFIDDLQWADSGTFEMLSYLCQNWSATSTPVLFVFTVRQEAFLTSPGLRDRVQSTWSMVPVDRVELAALTDADVRGMVHELAAADLLELPAGEKYVVDQFAGWLYQETGGQPFTMHEMVRMLAEQEVLPRKEENGKIFFDVPAAWRRLQTGTQVPIPPNVRQLMLTRQGRLSEPALALLWAGAVVGRDCTFKRLCQVSDVAEPAGVPALEELLNGRFLLENRAARRPYTFAHDSIREVAYTEAGEARRRIFHRRALVALERDEAPPAELAFHALAAHLAEPAVRHSIAAGDAARAACAYDEALAHYEEARALAPEISVDPGLLARLYTGRGRSLELATRFDEAMVNYTEMVDLAQKQADAAFLAGALIAFGAFLLLVSPHLDLDRSREMMTQALRLTRAAGRRPQEATALWHLSRLANHGDDLDEAIHFGEASLAIARDLDLQEQLAFTLHDLHSSYAMRGDFKGTLERLVEVRGRWQALGNLPMLGESLWLLAVHHCLRGEYDEALAVGEESVRLLMEIDNLWNLAPTRQAMAWALREQGEYGRAAAYLEEIIEVDRDGKFGWGRTMGSLILSQVYHDVGLTVKALAMGLRGLDFLRAMPMTPPILEWIESGFLMRHQIWRGALPEIQAALRMLEFEPADLFHYLKNIGGMKTTLPVELALAAGAYQEAIGLVNGILAVVEPAGMHLRLPDLQYYKGKALLALGDAANAYEAFRQAEDLAEQQGARRISWQILSELADIERARGEVPIAEALRGRARKLVHFIAEHAGPEGMRASFLSLPAVAHVLEN